MNVRNEIERFAKEDDKPILLGLFSRYHWASQWRFVATCILKKRGEASYECDRVWSPTEEGRILYKYMNKT